MTETDEILKAIDVAIRLATLGHATIEEAADAARILRIHRDRLERERAFVETAKEVCEIIVKYDPWSSIEAQGIAITPEGNPFKKLRDAYRALVSEPGERT